MKEELINNELGANRLKLAERRIRGLFSDVFDEAHAVKAYLNIHPTTDENIREFIDQLIIISDEFTIHEIADGTIFYQD